MERQRVILRYHGLVAFRLVKEKLIGSQTPVRFRAGVTGRSQNLPMISGRFIIGVDSGKNDLDGEFRLSEIILKMEQFLVSIFQETNPGL
jgi:hypothetical protein